MDGSTSSYQPVRGQHYYDMHTISYASYYTLWCNQQHSPIHFIAWSEVSSQDALNYTPEYDFKYASNSTQCHILSLLDSMLPGELSRSVQIHSKYVPRYTSKDTLMYTSEHALKNTPNCTWWYTRSHICSYVGSQDALKHTSKQALKYVPNCITWYTPSLLGSMLPSSLSRGKTLWISNNYMLPYMLLGIWSRDLQSSSPM